MYPHITLDGSEDRLAGYTAMPLDLNPYRQTYGCAPVAPSSSRPRGTYDVVFDSTNAGGGPFTFRYWVNDVTPPRLKRALDARVDRRRGDRHRLRRRPSSIVATLDGKAWRPFGSGTFRIPAAKGRHRLVLRVADYQETKNMEDVAKILPTRRRFGRP